MSDQSLKVTLDGTEYGSEVAMTAMGLEEVAKYLMLPHYQQFWAGGYSVNADKFEALPDDLQAILEEGLWALGVHMRPTYDDMIITERDKMLKAGVTFVTLPDADIAALSRAGLDAMDDIAAQSEYAAEAVQIIRESLAKFGRG